MNQERLTVREVDEAAMRLIARAESMGKDRKARQEIAQAARELQKHIDELEVIGVGSFSLAGMKGLMKRIHAAVGDLQATL
jgi:hypothetical protein